jgi:hypothetical protein
MVLSFGIGQPFFSINGQLTSLPLTTLYNNLSPQLTATGMVINM